MLKLAYKVSNIAIKAGEITLKFYGKSEFKLKDDASPLTQADLESNAFITKELEKISEYLVCSEEAVLEYEKRKNLEYFWLIDPLDGTKDFLAQNHGFTINIALIHKNRPILGVVYAPALKELYFGALDSGAYALKNIKDNIDESYIEANKIKLNKSPRKLESNLIACDSIFHSTQETQEFIKQHNLTIKKAGSSLKFCVLASNEADLYPRFAGSSEWDIAAGNIILKESGGIIIEIKKKKEIIYNKESLRNANFIAFKNIELKDRFINI